MLCVDVDRGTEKRSASWLSEVKALYQFSWLKRRVERTRNGVHVYIDVPLPKEKEAYEVLMVFFGDDPKRLEMDLERWGFMHVNVCFKNNEVERRWRR